MEHLGRLVPTFMSTTTARGGHRVLTLQDGMWQHDLQLSSAESFVIAYDQADFKLFLSNPKYPTRPLLHKDYLSTVQSGGKLSMCFLWMISKDYQLNYLSSRRISKLKWQVVGNSTHWSSRRSTNLDQVWINNDWVPQFQPRWHSQFVTPAVRCPQSDSIVNSHCPEFSKAMLVLVPCEAQHVEDFRTQWRSRRCKQSTITIQNLLDASRHSRTSEVHRWQCAAMSSWDTSSSIKVDAECPHG